jgi:excisionase family DNA binding protein
MPLSPVTAVAGGLPEAGEACKRGHRCTNSARARLRTVRNYVRDGRLKGVQIGKQYRITRGDLEAFNVQAQPWSARFSRGRPCRG